MIIFSFLPQFLRNQSFLAFLAKKWLKMAYIYTIDVNEHHILNLRTEISLHGEFYLPSIIGT